MHIYIDEYLERALGLAVDDYKLMMAKSFLLFIFCNLNISIIMLRRSKEETYLCRKSLFVTFLDYCY